MSDEFTERRLQIVRSMGGDGGGGGGADYQKRLVEMLEMLTEEAKAGRIRSLIATGLTSEGDVCNGWVVNPQDCCFTVLGIIQNTMLDFREIEMGNEDG